MRMPSLTILNTYTLKAPAEAFTLAIRTLAARVEAEGHSGVLSYRFFVNAEEGIGRAVIDYDAPSAWIGHHDISMEWPEMKALHAVATLSDVTFLGQMTDEISAWLARSQIKAKLHTGYAAAAGFCR